MQTNEQLPSPVQQSIASLRPGGALPLGLQEESPVVLLRLDDGNERLLDDELLTCEYKPTILLMPYEGKTVGICIVQFRLNGDDRLIYTMYYHLGQPKMYEAAFALLKMMRYDTVIATATSHRLMSFEANFVGTFNPQLVLQEAHKAIDNDNDQLAKIVFEGITLQFDTPIELWRSLEKIAPAHKRWLVQM